VDALGARRSRWVVPRSSFSECRSSGESFSGWREARQVRLIERRVQADLSVATSTLYQRNTATLRRLGVANSRPRRVRWLHFDRPDPGVSLGSSGAGSLRSLRRVAMRLPSRQAKKRSRRRTAQHQICAGSFACLCSTKSPVRTNARGGWRRRAGASRLWPGPIHARVASRSLNIVCRSA
jgi:hypothetical protein